MTFCGLLKEKAHKNPALRDNISPSDKCWYCPVLDFLRKIKNL